MKLKLNLTVLNIGIFVLILVGGFLGAYLYRQSSVYISTNDASVTGKQIIIAAPTAGQLISWHGQTGTTYGSGATVGVVQMTTEPSAPNQNVSIGQTTQDVPISMPQAGTIALDNVANNEYVAPGTPLAYAYNLNDLFVVANIKETQVQTVKVGDPVTISVDAHPGIVWHGRVNQIGFATASTFALLPTTSSNANFTKVTQVIPVKIVLNGPSHGLVPGLSVTVHIRK